MNITIKNFVQNLDFFAANFMQKQNRQRQMWDIIYSDLK